MAEGTPDMRLIKDGRCSSDLPKSSGIAADRAVRFCWTQWTAHRVGPVTLWKPAHGILVCL